MLDQLSPTVNIEYNRSTREYNWTDPESGLMLSVPAKQKGELFRAAVSMLDPDLYAAATRLITKNPHFERITWRAVEIVISNGVETFPAAVDGTLAMVNSSDGMGRYAVTNEEGYMACQCEHYASFDAPMSMSGHRFCKHIVAFLLYQRTRENRF